MARDWVPEEEVVSRILRDACQAEMNAELHTRDGRACFKERIRRRIQPLMEQINDLAGDTLSENKKLILLERRVMGVITFLKISQHCEAEFANTITEAIRQLEAHFEPPKINEMPR